MLTFNILDSKPDVQLKSMRIW